MSTYQRRPVINILLKLQPRANINSLALSSLSRYRICNSTTIKLHPLPPSPFVIGFRIDRARVVSPPLPSPPRNRNFSSINRFRPDPSLQTHQPITRRQGNSFQVKSSSKRVARVATPSGIEEGVGRDAWGLQVLPVGNGDNPAGWVGLSRILIRGISPGRDFSRQIEKFASKRGGIYPFDRTARGNLESSHRFPLPLLSIHFNPATVYFAATTARRSSWCTFQRPMRKKGCVGPTPFFGPSIFHAAFRGFINVDSINHRWDTVRAQWNFSNANFNRALDRAERERVRRVFFFEVIVLRVTKKRNETRRTRGEVRNR